MASSTIKQQQPVLEVEDNVFTYDVNTSFCASAVTVSRKYGKVVHFRIEFHGTATQWTGGNRLYVGNIYGDIPQITTFIPVMITGGSVTIGWCIFPTTSGSSLIVDTLSTIPQNATLVACGTYICN